MKLLPVGTRSYIFGMHNPIFHSYFMILAWRKLYHHFPDFRTIVCIIFHDIGYLFQDCIDGTCDRHIFLGAQICGKLFGLNYYNLCIQHSRDYCNRHGLEPSRLCYADKYSILLIPNWLLNLIVKISGEDSAYYKVGNSFLGYPLRAEPTKAKYSSWFRSVEQQIK